MEWRVRPGLYQPGLYVTGNTGQNVEEWLRHLQDPNPLPYIEPAAAPAVMVVMEVMVVLKNNMMMMNKNKEEVVERERKEKL